jgi:hypothetical protein
MIDVQTNRANNENTLAKYINVITKVASKNLGADVPLRPDLT